MWPPRPFGCSPITVLHQSPRMYSSEIDSGRSPGSTLCLSIRMPSQFNPWLDTRREDGPRRSASKCVFLLARTGLISFTSPHDAKASPSTNRKDCLARTRKHHGAESMGFRQTIVTGGRPMSRVVGITPQLLFYSLRIDLGRGKRRRLANVPPGPGAGLRPVFSAIWAPHKESTESARKLHTDFDSAP